MSAEPGSSDAGTPDPEAEAGSETGGTPDPEAEAGSETGGTPDRGAGSGGVVGLGVDLCDVDRMRAVLDRTPGFADRTFTAAEQQYCRRARDPAERFAARFAAKEAVLKALGAGLGACRFTDIEVERADSSAPSLRLHGAAAALAAERGVRGWQISLTHTKTMAEAVVIALGI